MGFAGDRARGIRDRKKRGEGNREFVVKEMEIKRGVMEIIENLLFGDNVTYLQCSKCKVKLSSVDTIVLHGTVGQGRFHRPFIYAGPTRVFPLTWWSEGMRRFSSCYLLT